MRTSYDAVVVGSGPNGLAAAIVIASAGCSALVLEAEPTVGGGARSAALTLPGFVHDVCSCVHPMAAGSPFFRTLPLEKFGLRWIQPEFALAHPFDDGSAALIGNGPGRLAADAAQFGKDERAVNNLLAPLVESWGSIAPEILGH